jgi:MFS family permease
MFRLTLFRSRAVTAGNVASLLAALARGGLQFSLIIWLQGIWLPEHGYSFTTTPLWAGIYMLPNIGGFLLAGPLSGVLSDRFGARPFATGGMFLCALSFLLLLLLPVDFPYPLFALLLALNGAGTGLFASPNRAGIMNSLPPRDRGVGAGMATTFQNSAQVLSMGVFFSLMIIGLSGSLPSALLHGLLAHGVKPKDAIRVSHLPPVSTLFATFLGYNPVKELLGAHAVAGLHPAQAAVLLGHGFFPHLISGPFSSALEAAYTFALVCCLIAAGASWLRGGRVVPPQEAMPVTEGEGMVPLEPAPPPETAVGANAAAVVTVQLG